MFKLKKLELLGFKSFADRTRLEFADGTVAVVGPNGCGKSNLSDAISWVLGEQSARLLRGERMADVIFNGTGTRPPTGMAEVSLTLIDPEYEQAGPAASQESPPDNLLPESEASPAQPVSAAERTKLKSRAGEILVTRRLFRSGESEYLINGEVCRLRDIQDLFMGTGLGPESYAIIEQGRIGQILSSKPSDRRAIIEEAAGVSKFKTRKRLAEAKLESSRQNLARITDILEEITKQVNSLKRQASKARRYRELQQELRGRQKVVLTSRLMVLEAECNRLRETLAQAQAGCTEAAQSLEERERELKAAAEQLERLEAQLNELREQIAQSDLERERLQSRLDQARQRATHLETRAADASREGEEVRAQLSSIEEQITERARHWIELQKEFTSAQEAAAGLLGAKEDFNNKIAQVEIEVENSRQAALAAVSRAAELRNQLVQAQENRLSLERQTVRVESEGAVAQEERRRLAAELESLLEVQRQEAAALAELERSIVQTSRALDRAREAETTRRGQLESLRQELSASLARKQALEESLARHAYTTESVRKLLSGEIPVNGHRFRPLGVLADFVEVAPGYEEVVEEFLKQELDCVVVERHDEARSGISLLRSEGTGRSTFFVTRIPTNGHANGYSGNGEQSPRQQPGVVAGLRELVRFEARLGLNGDLALPALESAYIVEDPPTAERLAAEYPECHFLTRSGEHYHHRLVSGGKGPSSGPLALRRDFRELERHTTDVEASIKGMEAALAEVSSRVQRLDEEFRKLNTEKLEAEKKAVLASEKLRQAHEASERAAERRRVLENDARALEDERKGVATRQAALRAELAAASAEQGLREQEIVQTNQRLRDLRARLDQVAQDLLEAQARASALEERTRAMATDRSRLDSQREDLRQRLERLTEQIQAWRDEQQELAHEVEQLSARLRELEQTQRSMREQWSGLEQESHAARASRDALTPQVDAVRADLEARRERRSEAEVALARAESDFAHHVQQTREELNADPAQLTTELAPEAFLTGEALQTAEAELRELKTRLENLGPVNMMALEELQEAEERFQFLETQRQDLLASIEDTAQAIREIDEVSRQQFVEAFKSINSYFAESFRTLFGGGIGEMRLSDETDPESGIDIAAQPPGKRLQNVLLLSGGEKALAALALLIAIFRYTPSPFCVLDEVDAPLDESNVDRFTRMIQQMSRHTQFILITHNKRTMEMTEVMYGVTMEEPGVSKLVSVRFDQQAREPVAA